MLRVNGWTRPTVTKTVGLLIGLCVIAPLLFADGGIVQFQRQAGPFFVTVFSTPVPLRVGSADLSVMVQRADDRSEMLNCDVTLELSKPDDRDIQVHATAAEATNKLVYAAPIVFPSAGKWQLSVDIKEKGDAVRVNGDLAVSPELPPLIAHWAYFALVPVAVVLFGLNQWLKAKRKIRNRRARP
jgi:hypothetical protein